MNPIRKMNPPVCCPVKMFQIETIIAFVLILVSFPNIHASMQEIVLEPVTEYEGMVIDSIEIDNRDIFDLSNEDYDNFLFELANKFHIKTKKSVIRKEILFQQGDTFSQLLIDESTRNLRERFQLYDVYYEIEILSSGNLLLRIITIDQWSLSVGMDYKRDGNESQIKLGATEKNLLGYNKYLSFDYISQTDDDNYIETSYSDRRLLNHNLRGIFSYSNNPINGFTQFILNKPFYHLSQQYSYQVLYRNKKGRIDYYSNDSLTAQSKYLGDYFNLEGYVRYGSPINKHLFGMSYEYNYEEIFDTLRINPQSAVMYQFPADSNYHSVKLLYQFSQYRYKKLKNIDGFNYTEDVKIGPTGLISYKRYYDNKFSSHILSSFSTHFFQNYYRKGNLFLAELSYTYWYRENENLRRQSLVKLSYYNTVINKVTLAMQSRYYTDFLKSGDDNLVLGGVSYLRGYDKFYLTGDKLLVFNTEVRIHPQFSILNAYFGATIFADFGQIVQREESFALDKFDSSIGAGLRIAFEKTTRNIIRIDLAYSAENNWTISAGSGMYFGGSFKN